MHKTPYVFPIIGGRKVEHLKQNIQALDISLSPEQIQRIDNANPIDLGFPYTVIVRTAIQPPDMIPVAEPVNRVIIQKRRSLDEA
jgi:diketogulonate reductase-like aldo/keto reductase